MGFLAEGAAKGHNTAGPGWLAYVPGGGLFRAAVADFLACGVNRFVGVWEPAPVLAQMEATAVRWSGIHRGDSITLDPHKSMFLPYGTGALLVRGGRRLREAHEIHAESYLQDLAGEEEIPNFADYSPELSREFRGFRVWLPIQMHGLGAFRAALDEKLDLALHVHKSLGEIPGIELPVSPRLSTVVFRVAARVDEHDEKTREILRRINATRRVFLSSTDIGGRFTIRVCILSHRTHRDRIDELIEIVTHSAAEVLAA